MFTVLAFIALCCFSIDIQYLEYVRQYVNIFWHLYATVRPFDMCACAQPFVVISCIGVCSPLGKLELEFIETTRILPDLKNVDY